MEAIEGKNKEVWRTTRGKAARQESTVQGEGVGCVQGSRSRTEVGLRKGVDHVQ